MTNVPKTTLLPLLMLLLLLAGLWIAPAPLQAQTDARTGGQSEASSDEPGAGQSAGEQNGESAGERAPVMELSPNPVGRGDRFSVTIEVHNPEFSDIEVAAPRLDESIGILSGPYIRPFYEYPEEGGRIEKSRITYVYSPRTTGRYEIGSYRIETAEAEYSTEPRLLEVGIYYQRELVVPPQLQWRIPETSVYVGENLPCILEVTDEPEIGIFENLSVEKPAEGFFQQAPELGEIRPYSSGGVRLYTIPVDGYLFTPSAPGRVTIPRAVLRTEGITSRSGSPVIEVQPLPGALAESGAIGSFTLSSSISRDSLTEGEELQLIVRIEGTGNLNYLRPPEPQSQGFRLIGEEERSQLDHTAAGFSGYREVIYTLAAERSGRLEVAVPRMAAMRPADETIYRLNGKRYSLEVREAAAGDGTAMEEELPFRPRELSEMSGTNITSRYAAPVNYLWLLPGPLTFLLFLFLRRKKMGILALSVFCFLSFAAPPPEESPHIRKGLEAYAQERYSEAMVQFELALDKHSRYPDLYFNTALAAYRNGDIGKAVYFSREAAYLAPGESEYTRFLSYIEERNEFGRRVPLPFPIHPDFLFLVLTVALNVAGFLGVIYLYKGRNLLFIATTLTLVIAIGAGVALGVSAHSRSNRAGVVIWKDTAAQVIPRIDASSAFALSEGETVLILGKSSPFYFVENAMGQKGWLAEHEIRIVGEPESLSAPPEGKYRSGYPYPRSGSATAP
jgi:tetratricopeptide (TPR) repeat protein